MSKPEDIPQDVWDEAMRVAVEMEIHAAVGSRTDAKAAVIAIAMVGVVARAILAAKAEERSIFTDAGRDNDALNSAVGVLRTQQAQPHKSTQSILWEAIQDYAERAKVNTAHKNSEVQ